MPSRLQVSLDRNNFHLGEQKLLSRCLVKIAC